MKFPLIVSHRGAKKEAPENTASAFDRALTYPIDGIELDVQITKDNAPIIHHDKTLQKISGEKKIILDYTYKQLESLDFGIWFSPDFKGEKVLTLQETLDAYFQKTRLFVEIKSHGWDIPPDTTKEKTGTVIDFLRRARDAAESRDVYVLTFDRAVLELALEMEPSFKYILNISKPAHLEDSDMVKFSDAWGVCTNVEKLTQDFADTVHNSGFKLLTYTCNDQEQADRAMKFGVDVLMTDDPGWFFENYGNGDTST
jgi:glycerophosphoryl diester phosphodiesterase